ncbi:lariat debranching enzyme, C-terminal domain-containing protein [Xylariaceae sp. FL0016]|nr:lariat debranching enzyme, C-terminal domain-containing protein [Xylariaceae sp. FL0016]
MEAQTLEAGGVRVAIEGCGHGTLDAIYASVGRAARARFWDGVDLLIIGGDFQAARNAADLSVMSVPVKYREMGDFHAYYSGAKKAPYLTIFIGGNHEASSYLWELYYGGWVAPNIYYLGAANVLRFGPLRIAGMSGIWKGFDYRKPHHERLPFSEENIKSFYHVREIDVRKLLLLREQVDVGLSHDWPRAIENHGDANALWRMKPDFRQESIDGTLGNPAAEYVMDRLRPAYWFSAHLHCKFSAVKNYPAPTETATLEAKPEPQAPQKAAENPDEIDLDEDDDDSNGQQDDAGAKTSNGASPDASAPTTSSSTVPDALRAQLPASFAKPEVKPKVNPGQPVPSTITNTTTRFLALDKCLPGRKYIQVCDLTPVDPANLTSYPPSEASSQSYTLSYDPEWLAITRVMAPHFTIGHGSANPPDLGEAAYAELIDRERAWVDEHIVRAGKLAVPEKFTITAPPHQNGDPKTVPHQPEEYTNPQTSAFCVLVGVPNLWDATAEERIANAMRGPPASENSGYRGGRGGRGGRGRGGHGGRGRGRGRGRGHGGWR